MIKNTQLLSNTIFFFILLFLSARIEAQDVLRVLAIGNSFSEDAVESYLSPIAQADGLDVIIGNMYIGGASLETHWNNARDDLSAYSYRKIIGGELNMSKNQSLLTAIKDEHWDIITFQQVSQNSGRLDSYFPYISDLLQLVKLEATNPNVKFALHQTWAYATNATHFGFVNYNNDQEQMYRAIVESDNYVLKQTQMDFIIPAGTSIQNGRTSFIDDNFCRDGYHLSYQIGRYTAACAWYEKLFDTSVIGNSFIPVGMSEIEVTIAQFAAHYAVLNPSEITSLSYFSPDDQSELGRSVKIYMGSTATEIYSNNFSTFNLNDHINVLTTSSGIKRERFGDYLGRLKSFQKMESFQIFDITGRKIFEETLGSSHKKELNLNYFDSGYYLIRLGSESIPMVISN